jgi:hypothetical protein
MVQVTLHRDQSPMVDGAARTTGDTTLPLFFAPVLGIKTASLAVKSTATLHGGVGFGLNAGSAQTVMVLPITLDKPTWDALLKGVGSDNYAYNTKTGAVTSGSDGILEVDLYPYSNTALPSGNRGTVDIGSPNNSTADLKRQIVYGLNATDLSYFGGQIRTDQGPIVLNGDTGISAGIKAALASIIGQTRLVLSVTLTGSNKHVVVQPAPFVDPHVITGNTTITSDSYYSPAKLLH